TSPTRRSSDLQPHPELRGRELLLGRDEVVLEVGGVGLPVVADEHEVLVSVLVVPVDALHLRVRNGEGGGGVAGHVVSLQGAAGAPLRGSLAATSAASAAWSRPRRRPTPAGRRRRRRGWARGRGRRRRRRRRGRRGSRTGRA